MATPESAAPAATDMDTTDIFGDGDDGEDLGEEIARAEPDEIAQRTRMLENEIKVLRNENSRLLHEQQTQKEKIKENAEKIKLNKQLPYLVANVVELLDMDPEDEPEEDGANIDLDAHRKGKCCELIEAIVLQMTHKERFANLGIKPPKGALMYGPPGTGKTLIARACAAQTNACFLKLAGPQLVQMFIGDGAKLVNFEELGRCTDDFNGAQLKAVCVEAGMIALRNERTEIVHEDFMEGLTAVQAKKKATLSYYA
ncbi:hypothetical protein EMIHUDRAFT_470356 [Emiliania huxleyi CCMP1516]|uniref:AAA ATPase AAA+ lid domain-containing protein n=2 Tax=Emiliania huxleyi TaxID=2903 RepID=A0A0D3J0G0_EMIH1|nr:hypothetical protein EMIHUDRAFT_470356 [Emiliania huxleyi CCMP1516]EOD16995.1 hypothetical protein EMIHUDRAFT_470356 [Emiliania huxleyi CCMP1516]|eukprot:XP_005769424.1 hypothetical protein EMIHUDRAFT_470356 [Emiliania huxleyi CCMP1516]